MVEAGKGQIRNGLVGGEDVVFTPSTLDQPSGVAFGHGMTWSDFYFK